MNTLATYAENMVQIGYVVPELHPSKAKSHGRIYLSSHIYSAIYGIYVVFCPTDAPACQQDV